MPIGDLNLQQPGQHAQAGGQDGLIVEEVAGDDDRLGQGCVGIGEPLVGPWPGRVGSGTTDGGSGVGQHGGGGVAGIGAEHFGGAERGEGHGRGRWTGGRILG
jgi:hypothetical protein